MVKIGFICEGNTEQILLQSDSFKNLLTSLNLESLPVIDAKGAGNLLPHNIVGYLERLEKLGAQKIFVLTDLDDDICITQTKMRIKARLQDSVIIAVKKDRVLVPGLQFRNGSLNKTTWLYIPGARR